MQNIDKRYQQYLKDIGLYQGAIDGAVGPNTKAALVKYQTMNGLTPDGVLGPKTAKELEDDLKAIPDRQQEVATFSGSNTYNRWPKETTADLTKFYGEVGTNQVRIDVPYKMVLSWDTSKQVKQIMCNKKVSESLYKVLETVSKEYSETEIVKHGFHLFGGCLNVRKIRGGNRYSTHSWGIAVDFDPARNGLRADWKNSYFSRPECAAWMNAWRSEGWYSLGLEKNYDAMHFQACHR